MPGINSVGPSHTPVLKPLISKQLMTGSQEPIETTTPLVKQSSAESFASAKVRDLGSSSKVVNASQDNQQIKSMLEHMPEEQLIEKTKILMQIPVVMEEFGIVADASKTTHRSISADMLTAAREKLKPVSQHQILNVQELGQWNETVIESGKSLKLKTDGSVFAHERLTSKSTLEIVGHGGTDGEGHPTIGGQRPDQLAKMLKAAGITQLDTIHLKSCHSKQFAEELVAALQSEDIGIQVKNVKGFDSRIAIDVATGKTLVETADLNLDAVEGHSGTLATDRAKLIQAADEVNKSQVGSMLAHPEEPNTILFSTRKYAELSATDKQEAAAATALAQEALQTAYDELIGGDYTHFEGSHFSHWQRNAAEGKPHDPKLLGYVLEERSYGILNGQSSMNSDGQITLKDLDLKWSKQSSTDLISGTRPDVTVTLSSGKEVYIDFTASNSQGHILDKGRGEWVRRGGFVAEATYTSFTAGTLGTLKDPNDPSTTTLTPEQLAAKKAKLARIESLETSLQGVAKTNIQQRVKRLLEIDQGGLKAALGTLYQLDSTEFFHQLSGTRPKEFGYTFTEFPGQSGFEDAVRLLDNALNLDLSDENIPALKEENEAIEDRDIVVLKRLQTNETLKELVTEYNKAVLEIKSLQGIEIEEDDDEDGSEVDDADDQSVVDDADDERVDHHGTGMEGVHDHGDLSIEDGPKRRLRSEESSAEADDDDDDDDDDVDSSDDSDDGRFDGSRKRARQIGK